jgi:MFS transporter, DHA2 family, multidrug resistance protein
MTATAAPAKLTGGDAVTSAPAAPAKAGLVLGTLIIIAAVANLPLAMANVALPSIGANFDASQTQL